MDKNKYSEISQKGVRYRSVRKITPPKAEEKEEMKMVEVRVSFIGYGGLVGKRLEPAVRNLGYKIVGAFDPRMMTESQARLESYGGQRFDTVESLLGKRVEGAINLAIVAGPHDMNPVNAEAAMGSKFHVFIEKPMSTSFEGALGLIELARRNGVGLWGDRMMTENPLHLKAQEIAGSWGKGAVIGVTTNMQFEYYEGAEGGEGSFSNFRWLLSDEEGGGPLWDVGPHCVDNAVANALASSVVSVRAKFGPRRFDRGVHEDIQLEYVLDNGAIGRSSCSFITPMTGIDNLMCTVYGTDSRRIVMKGTMFQHSISRQEGNDMRIEEYMGNWLQTMNRTQNLPVSGNLTDTYIYEMQIKSFVQALASGRILIDTRSASIVGVCRAALDSAKEGSDRFVDTKPYFDPQSFGL